MSVHGRRHRCRLPHHWPPSLALPRRAPHVRAEPRGVSAGWIGLEDAAQTGCLRRGLNHQRGEEVAPHPVIEKSTWHFRRAQQGTRRLQKQEQEEVRRPSGFVVVAVAVGEDASPVVRRRHSTTARPHNLPDETHNSRQPRRGSSFAHRASNFSRQVAGKLGGPRALPIRLPPAAAAASTCAPVEAAPTTRLHPPLLLVVVGLYSAVLLVASCQSAPSISDSHPQAAAPSSRPASHQFTSRLSSRSSDYGSQWTPDALSPRVADKGAAAEGQLLPEFLAPGYRKLAFAETTVKSQLQAANKQHHDDDDSTRRARRRGTRNKRPPDSGLLLDPELHNNYLNDETSLLGSAASKQSGSQTTLDLALSADEIEYRNWIGVGSGVGVGVGVGAGVGGPRRANGQLVCRKVAAGNAAGPNHAESCRMGEELWAKLCSITFSRDFSNEAHVLCHCCGASFKPEKKKPPPPPMEGAPSASTEAYLLEQQQPAASSPWPAPQPGADRNDNQASSEPLVEPPAAASQLEALAAGRIEAASPGSQWRRARATTAATPPPPTDSHHLDTPLETTSTSTSTSHHLNSIVYLMSNLFQGIHPTLPIALILGAIILVTFIGNVLVCLSVIKVRKLRHPSNYLLVSLAISDLCVACVVMPFGLYQVINDNWQLGRILCNVYVVSDVTSCTASILNLCVISIDRYLAITKPLTYCVKRTTRLMLILIAFVWICACLISVPPLLISGNEYGTLEQPKCEVSQSLWYQLYATCISFYIPLIVMICLYFNIYTAAKRVVEAERRATTGLHINHSTEPPTSVMRERKASITLGIIMTAFTVCWLPFFIMALLRPFSETIDKLPRTYVLLTLWLGYANSLLNPIIYVTFHRDFRNAFKHLLCITKKNSSILNNNNNNNNINNNHSSNKQAFA